MILAGIPIEAQGQTLSSRTLIVGTREVPPFAMKNSEGTWTGVSIDLWRQIAAALNLPFEFQERDLQGLLGGVANGSLDVAVAALSITAEHEKICDFSHPYYVTGLGIAIAPRHKTPWLVVLKRLFTLYYLKIVVGLCVLLLAIEALIFDAPILRYLIHHELKGALRFCRTLSTVKITALPCPKTAPCVNPSIAYCWPRSMGLNGRIYFTNIWEDLST